MLLTLSMMKCLLICSNFLCFYILEASRPKPECLALEDNKLLLQITENQNFSPCPQWFTKLLVFKDWNQYKGTYFQKYTILETRSKYIKGKAVCVINSLCTTPRRCMVKWKYSSTILTLALDEGKQSPSGPSLFTPGGKTHLNVLQFFVLSSQGQYL
jgi:hypothetical protein